MRLFVIASALFLSFIHSAAAQTSQPPGTVTVDLRPNAVELHPDESESIHGWINATIRCESGYSPRPIEVRVDQRSLEDEAGTEVWRIEPRFARLEFTQRSDGAYESRANVTFVVGAGPPVEDRQGKVEFELLSSGGGVGSNNCALFGTSWRFDATPYIDLVLRVPEEAAQTSNVPPQAASHPFDPSTVVVEDGPVRGESHVPTEAFVSLGVVLGSFSSYGFYEWRRGRRY